MDTDSLSIHSISPDDLACLNGLTIVVASA